MFISFVHSPQMSNDLIGQGSSRSVLEACSRRSTIQSKTGADFSQVSETTFWRSMCLFSEINSILRRMDEIDADFKVCFHRIIPQPDYSKPLASNYNLVGLHGNNPIILFQLQPNLVINFSLKNKKMKKILELLGFFFEESKGALINIVQLSSRYILE